MLHIPYYFYTTINNFKIYKELCEDKYILEYKENNSITCIHFYFDYDDSIVMPLIYKNGHNYRTYRYIKKYAENEKIMNAIKRLLQYLNE